MHKKTPVKRVLSKYSWGLKLRLFFPVRVIFGHGLLFFLIAINGALVGGFPCTCYEVERTCNNQGGTNKIVKFFHRARLITQ